MPITLPDFTALPQATPQATGYLPQYPQTDPGAAAQAKLGEGIEKVGQGVSTAGFYADIGKTKMDKAMADADFANRVIPINEALKTETDPEKIADLKGQYREALDIASNAIGNPEARAFWAAQNLQHVTRGEAGADQRNKLVYADKYQAGVVKQGAELGRNGVTDPDAFELAKTRIDQLVDGQIASGGSAAEGEKLRLKLKLDLVGGRIDHLIAGGQYDQALAVLNAHRPDIGGVMAGHIEQTIATKKQAGDVSAAIKGYLSGGGYTPGASLAAPAASDDDLWSRMKTQEKGVGPAGEAKVSPAGAIGISQIKPGTARDMAAKLGEPFDQQRLYTDHAYNERLGRRYLQDQLDKYNGNRVLAAAAYNAGPAQVDEWIAQFGDPRAGKISDAQFAAQIPFSETRNYVQAVGAVPSAVVQGQGGATRNLPIAPILNAQLDKAATTDGNLKVEVFSGGQPSAGPNRVGSHRHDEGDAADIQLRDTKTGQLLDMRKPEDQARMKNFITAAVAGGATGVGAAEDYMGPHGIHIGGGPPAAWGRDGASANAPGWVKGAFDAGRKQVGTLTPPVATAPAAAAPADATNALVPGQAVLGNTPLDAVPGGPKGMQSAAPIAITSGAHKGKYLLLPGVKADGSPATEDEALDQYEKDGKHLGIFNSPGDATAYANRTGTGAAPAPAAAPATSEAQRQYNEAFNRWQAANPGSDPKIFTDYRTRMGLYVPSAAPSAGTAPAATAPAARPAGAQTFDAVGGDSIARSGAVNADLPGSHAVSATEPVLTGSKNRVPVPGRNPGDAMAVGGRNPTGNLDYVNAHPDEFQGKKIFWSTGLMNAGKTAEEARAALPKVREQLDTLVNKLGAQVVLVGVDKGKFAPLNKELETLASEYKIPFAGALPTNDVHPGAAAMKEYARKAAQLLPAPSGDTGPPPAPAAAGTDTYVTPDSEGGTYGGGEPTETPTPGAAVSGGSREVRSPELITPSATPAPAAAGGTTTAGTSITKMPPGGWTPHVDVTEIERSVDANMAAGVHTPEGAAKIKAGLISELSKRDALVKPQRDELFNTLAGGEVLLKDGRPFNYSEDEIRHYYGKAEADKLIGALNDARDAGKITAQVRGATAPEQIEAMRAELQAGIDKGGALGAGKRKMLFDHFQTVAKTREAELDKSMVESEVSRYVGAGPGLAAISDPNFTQQPARDTNDLVQRVQADIDYGRLRPDIGREIQRGVQERVNVINAAEHNDKVALNDRVNASIQALADGKQVEPIDPTTIRHYFTPDEADKRIQALADAQEAGGYYAQIKNASPADISQQQYALAQRLNDPAATDYLRRREQLTKYNAALTKRNEELSKDPGGYLQTNSPLVTEKFNALLTDDARKTPQAHAQAFADFARATLAEQTRLGVPEEQRTILSKGQAAATAAKLATLDPTKVDVIKELRNMAQGYGAGTGTTDYWPKVFGEMVKEGKLPAGYQILASMDRPDQLVAAEDLSRALGYVAQKGGLAQIKEASSADVKLKLDQALETELADFKASTYEQSSGASLYDKVKDSAQALALYYGYKGQSQNEAVKHAVDGILRNKYDFGEIGQTTIRVPKGTLRDVERAADVAKAGVTIDQLGPVPVRDPALAQTMTPDQAKSIWINAIRDGGWVNNNDDSGIQLVGKFRDGALRRIERFDGTPVELRFSDVPAIVRSVPPTQPMGPEDIGLRLPTDIGDRSRVIGGPGAF